MNTNSKSDKGIRAVMKRACERRERGGGGREGYILHIYIHIYIYTYIYI